MNKRGGGVRGILIFRRKIFVSQYRNFSERNPSVLCSRKFPVAKKFMGERGEGISRLLVEVFFTLPKNFVGEPFGVSKKFRVTKNFMHKREISRFSAVKINLKNVGKGWDSNPYLPLQNPVVPPTVPWEPLEFPTNVSEAMKIFGTTETRTRTYRFRTQLSYSLCHGNYWNGISDKCQWNHKNIWHDRDSNPDLLLENPVVLTPHMSFIVE